MTPCEIVMAGTGGQGLIVMAMFLAEAAMNEGYHVAQTQSYGVAQRGGLVSAEVIMDRQEILFQQVRQPSLVVALHGVVGTSYDAVSAPVLYDATYITKALPNWHAVPITDIARGLGNAKTTNMVGLGALAGFLPLVTLASLEELTRKQFRPELAALNIEALHKGYEAGKSVASAS